MLPVSENSVIRDHVEVTDASLLELTSILTRSLHPASLLNFHLNIAEVLATSEEEVSTWSSN
jgi:hypothetical protein